MLLADGATVIGFDNNRDNMADTLEEMPRAAQFKGNLEMVTET